jgi:hypothetical protein
VNEVKGAENSLVRAVTACYFETVHWLAHITVPFPSIGHESKQATCWLKLKGPDLLRVRFRLGIPRSSPSHSRCNASHSQGNPEILSVIQTLVPKKDPKFHAALEQGLACGPLFIKSQPSMRNRPSSHHLTRPVSDHRDCCRLSSRMSLLRPSAATSISRILPTPLRHVCSKPSISPLESSCTDFLAPFT